MNITPSPNLSVGFIVNFNSGVAPTGTAPAASAAASVVGILLIGGLASVRPMTAAPSASVSLDSDYVCRMPKPYPFSTFGSFGDVNHEGRPVVCGGSRVQGDVVERWVSRTDLIVSQTNLFFAKSLKPL